MKTSIVILTYNKLQYTQECINSIRRYTKPNTYEIIVIDNNSTDGTSKWLAEQTDLKVVYNASNVGFPAGCNQGIEISSGEYILLLNNDTVVTTNWLDNLLCAINSGHDVGAVSCVTNNCSYLQSIPVEYKTMEELQSFGEQYNISDPDKWEQRLKLVGFCMLIKKSVIDKIGLLDECFTPGNYEDDDYSLRIRLAGYKLLLCKDTFIHHYGSTSFRDNRSAYLELMKKNEKKFESKWGFSPGYSQGIRVELIELMDYDLDRDLNVLEIGCACGGTLLKIKDLYKNSNLYGIELNEHSAKIASLIADVSASNIEEEELEYPESFFDVIIFADVLEHLIDPWKVLRNIKKYLKPTGKLLISLPNIMHISAVNSLLHGFWSYQDAGLLDRTHMRFFTLYEINKMLLEAGYIKLDVRPNRVSINDEEEQLIQHLSQIMPEQVVQQYMVYQYIMSVTNNEELQDLLSSIQENSLDKETIINGLQPYSEQEIINNINMISEDSRVDLLNTIAVIHFELGMYERVLPFFQQALVITNTNVEVLYNVSYFLYFIGERDMAMSYIEQLKDLDSAVHHQLMNSLVSFDN